MAEFKSFTTQLRVYDSAGELDPAVQILIDKAKEASANAYAPYSEFQVGAALLLADGEIVTGNNQENASYPAGICAERVAFFAAKSRKPDTDVKMVVIVAKPRLAKEFRFTPPCGICRQVMSEYEKKNTSGKIRLYLIDVEGKVYESESIANLLPFQFSDDDLKL